MPNQDKWCFAWLANPKLGAPGSDKGAIIKAAKWNPGDVITVSFLDGDPAVQAKVRKVAQEWTTPGPADLSFAFRNDTHDTFIRISFQYAGSWSVIGTTCKQITDLTQPTMNFGWLTPDSDDAELRRVVLHEFGHALGMIHEHQSPAGGIQWDREQVSKDLSGPPNSWTQDVIDHNMFEAVAASESNFTALDPSSIMMYPIPAKWTKNGFSVGLNGELSATDKQFIAEQYP